LQINFYCLYEKKAKLIYRHMIHSMQRFNTAGSLPWCDPRYENSIHKHNPNPWWVVLCYAPAHFVLENVFNWYQQIFTIFSLFMIISYFSSKIECIRVKVSHMKFLP